MYVYFFMLKTTEMNIPIYVYRFDFFFVTFPEVELLGHRMLIVFKISLFITKVPSRKFLQSYSCTNT